MKIKRKTSFQLCSYGAVIFLSMCLSGCDQKGTVELCDCPKETDLASIFIPDSVSAERVRYYRDKKRKPYLDGVVKKSRNFLHRENKSFYYKDASVFVDFLSRMIDSADISGLRIYFGSDEPQFHKGPYRDKGKILLIYSPTTSTIVGGKVQNKDTGTYFVLRGRKGERDTIDADLFKTYISGYRMHKAKLLRTTLSEADQNGDLSETYSVFFPKDTISTIKREIHCQNCRMGNKLGVEVDIVSYREFEVEKLGHPELKQRLTVQFTMTNRWGFRLNMEEEDKDRYGNMGYFIKSSSYDTGMPTPPYEDEGSF